MSFNACDESSVDRLQDRLLRAGTVTPELMSEVIAQAGMRFAALKTTAGAARIRRMAEAGAWTDAALALIELELPQWELRHLVREDGEWWCTLGRHSALPEWLDDTAEARHEVLPLAILSALVRARNASALATGSAARTVPALRLEQRRAGALCCDNFR